MMNTARVTNVFVGGNRPGQNDHGFGQHGGMGPTGGGRRPTGGGWGPTGGGNNGMGGIRNQLGQIQGQIQSLIGQLGGNGPNRQGALRQLIQLRNQLQQLMQLAGGNNPIISRLLNTLNTILGRFGVPSTGGGNGFPGAGGNGGWGGNGFPGAGGNGGWGGNGFPGAGGNGGWGGNGFPGGNGNGFGNNPFGNNGFGNNPFGNNGFGNNGFGNDPFGLGGFGNGLGGLNGQNGLNGLGGQNGGFPDFNNGNNGGFQPGTGNNGGGTGAGKGWGDPHMVGANGQHYDITGKPGLTLNMLTTGDMKVNTTLGAGTTMDEISVQDAAGNRVLIDAQDGLTINGQAVKDDGEYLGGGVVKKGNDVTVSTATSSVTTHDRGNHLDADFKVDNVPFASGGWGQSVTNGQGAGEAAGGADGKNTTDKAGAKMISDGNHFAVADLWA